MTNESLLKVLKGESVNNELPILNILQVKFLPEVIGKNFRYNLGTEMGGVTPTAYTTITSKGDALKLKSNDSSLQSQTCTSFIGQTAVYTSLANDILYATNKYDIKVVYISVENILKADYVEFDVEQLRGNTMKRIHFDRIFNSLQFLDFSWLDGSVETLQMLTVKNLGGDYSNVDPMYLAKFTSLTDINFDNVQYKPIDWKDFALAQIAAGRSTGSISITCSTNNKFNGELLTGGITFSGTLAWTSADDITLT